MGRRSSSLVRLLAIAAASAVVAAVRADPSPGPSLTLLRPSITPDAPSTTPIFGNPALTGALPAFGRLYVNRFDDAVRVGPAPFEPVLVNVAAFDLETANFDAPVGWTNRLEDTARREGGGAPLAEFQWAMGAARLPAWASTLGAVDLMRRQEAETWRQRALGALRSGVDANFAPTRETLFAFKNFYSGGLQRTMLEGKIGLAVTDPLSLGNVSLGRLYFGPLAIVDRLRFDAASKLGAHLTLSQLGLFQITLAAGYARDRFGGPSAFGRIESSFRF
jgi:hypothetical protein